jgi:hypothetical protein
VTTCCCCLIHATRLHVPRNVTQLSQVGTKNLRDKPGYSDTVLEGADLITYHNRIYITHALQEGHEVSALQRLSTD